MTYDSADHDLSYPSDGQDHAIDYNEFMQLFPVRVQRMRELKDLA